MISNFFFLVFFIFSNLSFADVSEDLENVNKEIKNLKKEISTKIEGKRKVQKNSINFLKILKN